MAGHLQNKVAIITGSNSGIGESIAIALASMGAIVTVCGRDTSRQESVFDKIMQVNGGQKDRVMTFVGDLTESKVREDLVKQTVETFGTLDILVTNAGVLCENLSLLEATEESFNSILDINLKSVFFLIQHAVPHLEKSKGNIIVITSSLTKVVCTEVALYGMFKASLDYLVPCLAVELGTKGIRVNAVRPGFVCTNVFRYITDDREALCDWLLKLNLSQQALADRITTGNDIAETVAFLASDSARCITGELITVDSGKTFSGRYKLTK